MYKSPLTHLYRRSYPYPMIILAVDAIMEKDNKLLMIVRGGEAYHGYLALPGGRVNEDESVEQAVVREIKEEVGVEAVPVEILGVYSDCGRDPRGNSCSVVFIVHYKGTPAAGDDASEFKWVPLPLDNTLQIAFDHKKIINDYIKWKKEKGTYWSNK